MHLTAMAKQKCVFSRIKCKVMQLKVYIFITGITTSIVTGYWIVTYYTDTLLEEGQ